MSYASSNQLGNITNNTLNSKQWRKPDLLARSATRELELQQKLRASAAASSQSSSQQQQTSSQQPLGASLKENGTTTTTSSQNTTTTKTELKRTTSATSNSSQGTAAANETTNKKKKFASFKFYLDTLDPNDQAKIERGIKLLGATQEQFFSKKCTHLITTKNIPIHENMLSSLENSDTSNSSALTNTTRQTRKSTSTAKDTIVQNALSWGISLWSKDVMLKTIDYLMKQSPAKYNRQQPQGQTEKRGLGKVLQEEKLFGPSTGANSEAHAKRPQFVPFTGHYLLIEDSAQTHRPVICKQYTKEKLTQKRGSDYPWPFFKTTPPLRSPFGKRAPPPQPPIVEKKLDENVKKQEVEEPIKEQMNALKISTPLVAPSSPLPITTTTTTTTTTTVAAPISNTPDLTPLTVAAPAALDSQADVLRASGFQPSLTTNTIASQSTTTTMQSRQAPKLPAGESVYRLDKRMVENISNNNKKKVNEQQAMHKLAIRGAAAAQAHPTVDNITQPVRKERQQQKKDLRYCENCNCQFDNMEEHMKDQTHQTFIRDQNNFKELDQLLERTHRVYKKPLPDRFKALIDTSIDGKHVKFISEVVDGNGNNTSPGQKRGRSILTAASVLAPNKLNTVLMASKQVKKPILEVTKATTTTTTTTKEEGKAEDKEQQQDDNWNKFYDVFL